MRRWGKTAAAGFASIALLSCTFVSSSGLSDGEIDALLASDLAAQLKGANSLGFTELDPAEAAKDAKAAFAAVELTAIDQKKRYPVILQIGHYPRQPGSGKTGTTGVRINEQEGAAWVVKLVSERLAELNIEHAIIGADEFKKYPKLNETDHFRAEIFLSFHFDGAEPQCAVGPSLGYNPALGKLSMQNIGVAVAIGLGLNARDFMKDNYTDNLKNFYGYGDVDSTRAEGLIELSELSCSSDEARFLRNGPVVADNIATALTFMLGLQGT